MKLKVLLSAALAVALPIISAGPASAAWIPEWIIACEGQVSNQGPSWDLGPECKAVESPARAALEATLDYTYAQAYAVCNFADGVIPPHLGTTDCSLFEPDDQ